MFLMRPLKVGLSTSQQENKDTDERPPLVTHFSSCSFLKLLNRSLSSCLYSCLPSITPCFMSLPPSLPPPRDRLWSLTARLPPSLSTPHHTACTAKSFPAEVEREIRLACRCRWNIGQNLTAGANRDNMFEGKIGLRVKTAPVSGDYYLALYVFLCV